MELNEFEQDSKRLFGFTHLGQNREGGCSMHKCESREILVGSVKYDDNRS